MKPVCNFPNYFVTEEGNVYSTMPFGGGGKSKSPEIPRKLKPKISNKMRRSIKMCKNGKVFTRNIAPLILETFIEPRPKGMLACHGINGTLDDSLSNLCWQTSSDNMRDKIRDGTDQRGRKNGRAKLTEIEVRTIRYLCSSNPKLQKHCAQIFDVHISTINAIHYRRHWNHLK